MLSWTVALAISAIFGIGHSKYLISQDCGDKQDGLQKIFDVAFKMIQDTKTELTKVVLQREGFSQELQATTGFLFEDQDFPDVMVRLSKLKVNGDSQASNDRAKGDREPAARGDLTQEDVIVYCTDQHFTKGPDPSQPGGFKIRDHVWDIDMSLQSTADCVVNGVTVTAMTYRNPSDSEIPSIIQICPWYLDKTFAQEVPTQCSALHLLSDEGKEELKNEHKKPADGFYDIVQTIIHELMHTRAGQYAEDSVGKDSYGWDNCVSLKDKNNVDSYALLCMMSYVIHYCGMKPSQDGGISKIDNFTPKDLADFGKMPPPPMDNSPSPEGGSPSPQGGSPSPKKGSAPPGKGSRA